MPNEDEELKKELAILNNVERIVRIQAILMNYSMVINQSMIT